jgi:hypothetical protein
VFKSTNGGGNWTAVNNGLTNLNVQTLASDPVDTDIIYAGTDFGSLFISMDGGASWSAIGGTISGADVPRLAFMQVRPAKGCFSSPRGEQPTAAAVVAVVAVASLPRWPMMHRWSGRFNRVALFSFYLPYCALLYLFSLED